jgi:hypothetical protein
VLHDTHLAISLIKQRLDDAHGEATRETYKVIGEPVSVQDAEVQTLLSPEHPLAPIVASQCKLSADLQLSPAKANAKFSKVAQCAING